MISEGVRGPPPGGSVLVEAVKEPMVKCRAEHVLVAGRRTSAVIFGAYAAEKIQRVDKYEETASFNDSITIMTLLQEYLDSRERKSLDSGSGRVCV